MQGKQKKGNNKDRSQWDRKKKKINEITTASLGRSLKLIDLQPEQSGKKRKDTNQEYQNERGDIIREPIDIKGF